MPSGVTSIDIFCVGGGGGGGGYQYRSNYTTGFEQDARSGGGAGGYTTTLLAVSVTPGEVLTIVVGAGGACGKYFNYDMAEKTHYGTATIPTQVTNGSSGGESSVSRGSTVLCSASGGGKGYKASSTSGGTGGTGGSGGGKGSYYYSSDNEWVEGVNKGSDGSDGGGKGQGTTTRYFAESDGTLYSTGGEAEAATCLPSPANSGDGGSGSWSCNDGASGIVIIRWS